MSLIHIGKLIRDARKERGWTQADLAEQVGRSRTLQPMVSMIEQGIPQSGDMMAKIAKVLDLDLSLAALQDIGWIDRTEAAIMDDPSLKREGKIALLSVYTALTGKNNAFNFVLNQSADQDGTRA